MRTLSGKAEPDAGRAQTARSQKGSKEGHPEPAPGPSRASTSNDPNTLHILLEVSLVNLVRFEGVVNVLGPLR